MTLTGFDAYRDPAARKLMIEFVASSRSLDPHLAIAERRGLNHVGLAHVYRDALAKAGQGHRVDYDPCEARR